MTTDGLDIIEGQKSKVFEARKKLFPKIKSHVLAISNYNQDEGISTTSMAFLRKVKKKDHDLIKKAVKERFDDLANSFLNLDENGEKNKEKIKSDVKDKIKKDARQLKRSAKRLDIKLNTMYKVMFITTDWSAHRSR